MTQMALAWVLNNPVVNSALVGASSPEQIEENAGTIKNLSFDDQELDRIEEILQTK